MYNYAYMQNTSQVKVFLSCTSFSSTSRMYTLMWLVFQLLECSYFSTTFVLCAQEGYNLNDLLSWILNHAKTFTDEPCSLVRQEAISIVVHS